MEVQRKPVPELQNEQWVNNLAFLTDLTSHLNELNVKLQGRERIITELYGSIQAFKQKLLLWEHQFTNKETVHFPNLTTVVQCVETLDVKEYVRIMRRLQRFHDITKLGQ